MHLSAWIRPKHRFGEPSVFGDCFGDFLIQIGVLQMDKYSEPTPHSSSTSEWEVFGAFCDWTVFSARLPPASHFMSSSWSSCCKGLKMRKQVQFYIESCSQIVSKWRFLQILMTGQFVSGCSDIDTVKEPIARYEKVSGAKINLEKGEGQWFRAWKSDNPLPGLFCWSDSPDLQ